MGKHAGQSRTANRKAQQRHKPTIEVSAEEHERRRDFLDTMGVVNEASGRRDVDRASDRARLQAVARLTLTATQERSTLKRLHRQALEARSAGATWTEIGAALRITSQAAQQRYGRGASS